MRDRDAFDTQYTQHALGFYGELGLIDRWLMLSLDGQLYRRSVLAGRGYAEGLGDFRLGFSSGLVTRPVRFTAALYAGVPTGDPSPQASGPAGEVARALPTGDGEADLEGRLSLGYSFGRARRWPLMHYLVAEAGFWARTRGFAHSFTYRVEVGTKLPWKFVDRFWIIARANGIESFLSSAELAKVVATAATSSRTGSACGPSRWGADTRPGCRSAHARSPTPCAPGHVERARMEGPVARQPQTAMDEKKSDHTVEQ